jgi:hypothetical protein
MEKVDIKHVCNQFNNVSIYYHYVGKRREVLIHIMQSYQNKKELRVQIYVFYKWLQYSDVVELIKDVLSSKLFNGEYGICGSIRGNSMTWRVEKNMCLETYLDT